MPKGVKKTYDQWVREFKLVHGDKYEYIDVFRDGGRSYVSFNCKQHGNQKSRVEGLLSGSGCKKCGRIKMRTDKKDYIKRSLKYRTDGIFAVDVVYRNNKPFLVCKCPKHGLFEQEPRNHFIGQSCRKCQDIKVSQKGSHTFDDFINKALSVHGNKYEYDESSFSKMTDYIKIKCPNHGWFRQNASNHANVGRGCSKCGKISAAKKIRKNPIINGGFSRSRFIEKNKGLECILYFLKCYNEYETFYKIGITGRDIKKRFSGKLLMPYKYDVLLEIKDEDAGLIYSMEKFLKKSLKENRYIPKISFNGKTECFSKLEYNAYK